jgi:hypothetical protein
MESILHARKSQQENELVSCDDEVERAIAFLGKRVTLWFPFMGNQTILDGE